MLILYRTNLDEAQSAVAELNDIAHLDVPAIGTRVRFTIYNGRVFDLEVVEVTYNVANRRTDVELHIPREFGMSIRVWMDHMRRIQENI